MTATFGKLQGSLGEGGGGGFLFPLVDLLLPHLLCCQYVKLHLLSDWLHLSESCYRTNLGDFVISVAKGSKSFSDDVIFVDR